MTRMPASNLQGQKQAREKDNSLHPKRRNVLFVKSVVIEDKQEDERQAGPLVGLKGKGKALAVREDDLEGGEVAQASSLSMNS